MSETARLLLASLVCAGQGWGQGTELLISPLLRLRERTSLKRSLSTKLRASAKALINTNSARSEGGTGRRLLVDESSSPRLLRLGI